MDGLERVCFEIISNVGVARSNYINAIDEAKKGNIDKANKYITEGTESFLLGHHAHASLIQKEAAGEDVKVSLILLHAEDQLMSAESFKIIALKFIDLYQELSEMKKDVSSAK
jgi:Phosphotransferase system cellobiose-specific component IIA